MTSEELTKLVEDAKAKYDALSPEEKAWHDYEQRRSGVMGLRPGKVTEEEWRRRVDSILPPMLRPEPTKSLAERIHRYLESRRGKFLPTDGDKLLKEAYGAVAEKKKTIYLEIVAGGTGLNVGNIRVFVDGGYRKITDREHKIMLDALNAAVDK